jgi:hypothetical protein
MTGDFRDIIIHLRPQHYNNNHHLRLERINEGHAAYAPLHAKSNPILIKKRHLNLNWTTLHISVTNPEVQVSFQTIRITFTLKTHALFLF